MRAPPVNPETLSLRPMVEDDFPFLLALYGSTREAELAPLGWPDEHKQLFIAQQFAAQHRHYQTHYPEASFDIILCQGEAVGRFYVEEWPDQFRVVDIALLPAYCNRGIGSWFLRDIQQRTAAANKAVSIHVERNNPALRLYQRLGFTPVGEQGFYDLMMWPSSTFTVPPLGGTFAGATVAPIAEDEDSLG